MKVLVVYFSKAGENSVGNKIEKIEKGFTEIFAQKISHISNSHIFKLEPVTPYPNSYEECVERAKIETSVPYLYSEFKIDEYDFIFLGFPIWYRTYPRIIKTFIDNNNWNNKIVIPFCTNEEGAFGVAELELRSALKGALIKNGLALKGIEVNNKDKEIEAWVKAIIE